MKTWVLAILALVLVAAWYVFRPEGFFINRYVNESFPSLDASTPAQAIETGTFHSVLHPTQGMATIYSLGGGRRILRFTHFSTANGPNVHVYMIAADDAKDNATVKHTTFIDLGSIKGNIGNQNYNLGPDVDLSKYHAVLLWCKRFRVNFGAAPLTPESALSHK